MNIPEKIILNNPLNWILSWNEWITQFLNWYLPFLMISPLFCHRYPLDDQVCTMEIASCEYICAIINIWFDLRYNTYINSGDYFSWVYFWCYKYLICFGNNTWTVEITYYECICGVINTWFVLITTPGQRKLLLMSVFVML